MKSRQPSPLEELLSSDPGREIILPTLLGVQNLYRLSQTCRSIFQVSKKDLLLAKLAYYLAQEPDELKVQFIIKSNLNLLQVEFKEVVLPMYTVINVTPLQLVYGAGDGEMCGILALFFAEKYGEEKGMEEMQRQISEMKNDHKPFDFRPIIQAISNEAFNLGQDATTNKWILNPNTLAAIEKFRKDFDENQLKIIDKGMQFRWETLQELSDAYRDVAATWNNNHYYLKCALLEDVIFGWVFRYATKNDIQRFNQGLYYLQKENPEQFKRMKKTRDGHDFLEALKKPSVDFLLDSSCVDIICGAAGGLRAWRGGRGCVGARYKIFVEQKLQTCRTYAAADSRNATACNFLK